MIRQGKFLYENGSSLETKDPIFWVYHGDRYLCQHDGFGNFQIEYPHEWVDSVVVGEQKGRTDWDVGLRTDLGEVFLKIQKGGGLRQARLLYQGGAAVAREYITLRYRGQDWRCETDEDGYFKVEYPHSWVDAVFVAEKQVWEDWDIGDKQDMGTLEIEAPQLSQKIRSIRYLYHDKNPVADEVVAWIYRGEKYEAQTNSNGEMRIEYPHEWVDSVVVGGIEVRRDWDLDGKDYFSDFSLPNPATHQVDGEMYGVSGMIFWSDGTAVDKPLEVRWVDPDGYAWSTTGQGGYAREDGTFLIPFTKRVDPSALSGGQWYIGGNEPRFSKRVGASRFFHVLPDVYGGGRGTGGGLVTGYTVDRNGHPIDGVKVRGDVRSNALLPFLDIPDSVEVRSDRQGRFALGFQGGGALRAIYFNGNTPSRVYFKTPDGEEVDVPIENGLEAGSFSLYFVVPQTGFFSWLTN